MRRTRLVFGVAMAFLGAPGCSDPTEDLGNECPGIFDIEPPVPDNVSGGGSGGGGGGGSGGGGTSDPPATRTIDVAACAGAASQTDIDDNLKIVDQLEYNFYHTVTCGGFGTSFIYSLTHFFAGIACGKPPNPIWAAFVGEGVYLVGDVMSIQLSLVEGGGLGAPGGSVPFDLFNPATYFDSASIKAQLQADASWSTDGGFSSHVEGTYEMSLEGPRPEALALWNLPADGKNINVLQRELTQAIGEHVAVSLDFTIESEDLFSAVKYRVVTTPKSIGQIYRGEQLEMPVTYIEAGRPEIGQSVSLVSWTLEFVPTKDLKLDGQIVLKMSGGHFPYYVRYSYPKRISPDILVTCEPPPP